MNLFPTSTSKSVKGQNIKKITSKPISCAKANINCVFSKRSATIRNSNNISSFTKSNIINSSANTNKLTKSSNGHFNKLFLNYYSQKDFSYTPCEYKSTQRAKSKDKDQSINKNKSKLEYCDNSTLTSEQNYKEIIKAKDKAISQLRNELLKTQKELNDTNKEIAIASIRHNNKASCDSLIDKTYLFTNKTTNSYDESSPGFPFRNNKTENNVRMNRSSRSLQVKIKKSNNNMKYHFSVSTNNASQRIKNTTVQVNESLCLLKKRTQVLLNRIFAPYIPDKKRYSMISNAKNKLY